MPSTTARGEVWNQKGKEAETKETYTKYSKASCFACRMSHKSKAKRTILVGSILYLLSTTVESSVAQGYTAMLEGESVSGTGPLMRQGQMIESAFSKCKVNSRPEPACNDSNEEKDDAKLKGGFAARGDTGWEGAKRC